MPWVIQVDELGPLYDSIPDGPMVSPDTKVRKRVVRFETEREARRELDQHFRGRKGYRAKRLTASQIAAEERTLNGGAIRRRLSKENE